MHIDGELWCKNFFQKPNTEFKQTSYNHNFRKQYAGIGYRYDTAKDKFIMPQPFASWSLDDNDDWQPPIANPTITDDGQDPVVWWYDISWNEDAHNADNTKGWKATKSDDTADPKTVYDWNGTSWVSAQEDIMPRGKGSRLIGKQKTSTAASISAGNKSADDLRAFINGGLVSQGSASSVWTLREQFSKKQDGTWAGDLSAVSNAVAQPGGTMTVNSQPLGSYDYTFYNGPQTVSSFSNSDFFTTTEDSRSALIYINGNLTINACQVFKPSNRKLFTAIYVKGNLTVNGTISMGYDNGGATGRGANHSSSGSPRTAQAIKLISPGTYSCVPDPNIPAAGGNGGAGAIVSPTGAASPNRSASNTGSNGTGGGTGGGGSGTFFVLDGQPAAPINPSGAGSAGTAFTGGTGGGGVDKRGDGTVQNATAGAPNGGAGGNAGGTGNGNSSGGNGNPGGLYNQDCTSSNAGDNGTPGTAGSLVIYVSGDISGCGAITSNGQVASWNGAPIGTSANGDPAPGPSGGFGQCGKCGGSGGGGHVSIFYGTDNFGSGTVSADAAPTSVPAPNNPFNPANPGPSSPSPVVGRGHGIAGGNGTARKMAMPTG